VRPTDYQGGLTQERLRSLLHYEQETGVFTWKVLRPHAKIGAEAGAIHKDSGYRRIKIDGRPYTASRLAWLYMTGEWPDHFIDHIDLSRTNNAWRNLRAATRAQNARNRPVQKNTRSGLKGVHFAPTRTSFKKWAAHIRIGGVLKTLGYFEHPEEAHAAYAAASVAAFGQFARS